MWQSVRSRYWRHILLMDGDWAGRPTLTPRPRPMPISGSGEATDVDMVIDKDMADAEAAECELDDDDESSWDSDWLLDPAGLGSDDRTLLLDDDEPEEAELPTSPSRYCRLRHVIWVQPVEMKVASIEV